jgi:hypothetical protein
MRPVRLAELCPRLLGTAPYAFQFGMRRGEPDWFRLDTGDPAALLDRNRWLDATPERCLVWTPGAAEPLADTLALFPGCPPPSSSPTGCPPALAALARAWEPDFLLLRRDAGGEHRLVAGAVCFPSAWDVREKLGHDVAAIHGPVPTLNAALGPKIRTLLDRLPADAVFERENWGLAAHGERNAHPGRGLPRPAAGMSPDSLWLRVEHQAFRALPGCGGILFVIRLTVHPLAEVLAVPGASDALRAQLASMPEDIAAYKGLDAVRESLGRFLAQGSSR